MFDQQPLTLFFCTSQYICWTSYLCAPPTSLGLVRAMLACSLFAPASRPQRRGGVANFQSLRRIFYRKVSRSALPFLLSLSLPLPQFVEWGKLCPWLPSVSTKRVFCNSLFTFLSTKEWKSPGAIPMRRPHSFEEGVT